MLTVLLEVASDKIVFIAVMLEVLEAILFVSINSAALAVEASLAIADAFAVILAVLEFILFVSVNSAALAVVASAVIADAFAVILTVLDVILFVSANSAALAVVASALMAFVTSLAAAFKLIRLDKLVVSNVLADNCVGVTYFVLSAMFSFVAIALVIGV